MQIHRIFTWEYGAQHAANCTRSIGRSLLYVPTYVVIITINQIVLRLLFSERYTMPIAQVIPCIAHRVSRGNRVNKYSSSASKRVHGGLSMELRPSI